MVKRIFNPIVKAFKWLKKKYENILVKRAIRKANLFFNKTGQKFLVVWVKGRPVVKSKQELKRLVKSKYFVKGLTIQDIERMAIYKTR